MLLSIFFFFFQAEDGIRDVAVTGVQTCALPISRHAECHQQVCENRRELAARQVEEERQGGGEAAAERRLERMPDLPLTQRFFVEALALRRGRNHGRIPGVAQLNGGSRRGPLSSA